MLNPLKYFLAAAIITAPVMANADSLAYASMNNGNFGVLDLNTGVFTNTVSESVGALVLGSTNGTLYGGVVGSSALYSITPSNGALTLAGAGSLNGYEDFGSTPTGTMYAVDASGNLYSIATSGASSEIGSLGFSFNGSVDSNLSNNSGTLYLSYGSNLYTVNVGTGAATLVGAFGGSTELTALLMEGGTLWGADSGHLYTLNTTTGVATATSALSGSGVGLPFGLVPDPVPVPLPASVWLMLSGMVGVGALARKRRAV